MKQQAGKVRVVYKNFVVHPERVMPAHMAACAAGKQGKFLEFKHAWWEKGYGEYAKTRDPGKLGEPTILAIAKDIGLDMNKFNADRKGEECKAQIAADMKELNKFGVNGTPSFFVNGKFTMFSGPGPLNAMIDKAVADVGSSGVPAADYYQKVVIDKGLKKFRSKADASKGG